MVSNLTLLSTSFTWYYYKGWDTLFYKENYQRFNEKVSKISSKKRKLKSKINFLSVPPPSWFLYNSREMYIFVHIHISNGVRYYIVDKEDEGKRELRRKNFFARINVMKYLVLNFIHHDKRERIIFSCTPRPLCCSPGSFL